MHVLIMRKDNDRSKFFSMKLFTSVTTFCFFSFHSRIVGKMTGIPSGLKMRDAI